MTRRGDVCDVMCDVTFDFATWFGFLGVISAWNLKCFGISKRKIPDEMALNSTTVKKVFKHDNLNQSVTKNVDF